jgi:uncharacterized protein (DUF433 family)
LSEEVLEREFYPVREAARLLKVPESTLRWWLEGRRQYPPVLREAATGSAVVTWGEFVEAGYLRAYRKKDVPLPELRLFIDMLRQHLGVPHPLAHSRPFISSNRKLVVKMQEASGLPLEFAMAIEVTSGQLLLSSAAENFLDRVEFSAEGQGPALRIRPLGKKSEVVIDPARAFGAPSIRGIRTEALAELIDAGEPPEDVARDFNLPVKLVRAATAFEWDLAA